MKKKQNTLEAKQSTLKELEALLRLPDKEILDRHLRDMQRLYSLFFEEACSGCTNKQKTYLNQLRKIAAKKGKDPAVGKDLAMVKKEKEFKLKKGFLIRFAATTESYSGENLKDEIAISYLKLNPDKIAAFTKYPTYWKELIKN